MHSPRFATGTVVSVLMLQLLGGMLPGSSVVLCVAADGHTAVEAAHVDGRCFADYRRHHPEATGVCDLDQHACVDVVLSLPPLCSTVARDAAAIAPGAALPAATAAPFPSPARPLSHTTIATADIEPPPSAHRTIVLIV
ncbi:MAG: hypothetical protein U0587_10320 [Candidatus Binatia bacterium]